MKILTKNEKKHRVKIPEQLFMAPIKDSRMIKKIYNTFDSIFNSSCKTSQKEIKPLNKR